ncbi:MAG: recombinase family protein [Elusimicrobiaceae bacterium]|nr:recombinase family protein [Elusimicrobiaceae bacterium]
MDNFFSYKRISTKEERGLQKYNRQEAALKKYATENGIEFVAEFQEDVSGKSFDNRKEWSRLEKLVQPGDTIVFKDISRFTREANNGYNKYMELLERGIELVFIDNPTVSTAYIKQLLNVAEQQNIVARTSLESTVKLLIIVELDRVEQERLILINRIKCGISASEKQQGRKPGQLDKMTAELEADIKAFLGDRSIKQVDLMEKHKISRNTLKKYIELVKENS